MTESLPENTVISTKRKLAAVTASFIAFLLVAFSCQFIIFGIIHVYDERTKLRLASPAVILIFLCVLSISLTSSYFVCRKIAGKEYCKAILFFSGRVLRAISVWGISFLGMTCLSDFGPSSWSLRWIAFGTFNVPVLITLIRSYRLTEKQWDWCFLTFLILHANVVIALMFSEAWLPDIHFIRGLIFGQAFVLATLGSCFLYRSFKRQMSIPLFVHYGLGIWASPLVFYAVFTQWVV